jgi:hypothetical protein
MKDGFNNFYNFILCRTLLQHKVTENGKMWLFTYESERNWMMPKCKYWLQTIKGAAKFETPKYKYWLQTIKAQLRLSLQASIITAVAATHWRQTL